ncbi:FG-GAP repeat domain-containing protein [Planobispora siamensis]|uniref:FG-GAP repeat domain-containing protein n=1 Tax=Planobispora siamensis TaxID=936338 RepID=UPI0019520F33|nr:VCBS repeat-containing protein [Planobispora siamensis]
MNTSHPVPPGSTARRRRIVSLLAAVTLTSGALAATAAPAQALTTCAPGLLGPAVDHPVGITPNRTITTDLNEDGHADLVVSQGGTSTSLQVLLGTGDGGFQTPATVTVPEYVGSPAVGDFDGDDHVDLVVTNYSDPSFSVLPGNGDGTFRAAVTTSTVETVYSAVSGDFDGDGADDLATTNSSGSVHVLLGDGDGTFQPPVDTGAGAAMSEIVVRDFDSDGRTDLAVTGSFMNVNSVEVLLGDGDGTFQPTAFYPGGTNLWGFVGADFDADGTPDLATLDATTNSAVVLIGEGDGTFRTPVPHAVSSDANGLVAADIDGDGSADLIVRESGVLGAFSVLAAKGDGTFHTPVGFAPGRNNLTWAGTGDFNGDGGADVVLLGDGNGVSVMLTSCTTVPDPTPPAPPAPTAPKPAPKPPVKKPVVKKPVVAPKPKPPVKPKQPKNAPKPKQVEKKIKQVKLKWGKGAS